MRILVAEHNPQSRDFLKQVLQSEGYFVSAVSDGSEAIIGVNQEKPDLIISNPTLPELNGHEFCRQVKADSQLNKIPFVFYSSEPLSLNEKSVGMSLGALGYIEQPIETDDLLASISALLMEFKAGDMPVEEALLEEDGALDKLYEDNLARKLEQKLVELNNYRAELEQQLKLQTEQLTKAREEVIAANLSKSLFLTSLSDAITDPLQQIVEFSQSIIQGQANAPAALESAASIKSQADGLLQTISSIRDRSDS